MAKATPDQLAETIADNAAEVDEIAEDGRDAYALRFFELLNDPTRRDPDMWEDAALAVGVDLEWLMFSLADFNGFPMHERTLAWQAAHALTIAVAKEQAFTEVVLRDLIDASEKHAAKVDEVPTGTVRALAATGVHKRVFDEAKEKRKGRRDGNGESVSEI
jgi:hypothetical protein